MPGDLRFTEPVRYFRIAFTAMNHINPTGIRLECPDLTQLRIVAVPKIDFGY
jgi:hypothetical protein